MKQETLLREFSRHTAFSVFGMLGVSCYILADTFFISKGLGSNGLAALNLAIPIYNFIHGTGLMLGMGAAMKFSICKSQHRMEEVDRIYTNTLYLAALFSTVYFLIGLFFSKEIALALGANEGTLEMTDTYLHWLLLFAPAFVLNQVLLCFVRNDEGPQLSMMAMLIGSFSNIVLDYIFIFPMNMGIFGAVFATGLSPIISMGIMLLHWIKKRNTFHLVKTPFDFPMIRQIFALGVPSLIAQVSTGVVMIAFNKMILQLEGNTGIAAYGVIVNISLVIVAVYTGIAQGAQPLISRAYGIGDDKQIHTVFRYAMITMAILSGAVYLFLFIFARPVTAVFNSRNSAELQQIAETGLKIYFLSNLPVGYNTILATFFTSIEKALAAQALSILRGFVLILPMAWILSILWKMTGIWLAYPVTETLTAVLGLMWYQYENTKTNH